MRSTETQSLSQHRRRFFSHPLTITVVGFVLTGVIGAVFTWWLNSLSTEREIERGDRVRIAQLDAAAHTRAVEAVKELTDLINERRTRAVLVASSIYRGAAITEAEARKTAYDDVYVRWNTKLPSVSLRIREEIFKQLSPTEYEGYIQALTHQMALGHKVANASSAAKPEGYLTLMDACVTDAFDAYEKNRADDGKSAVAILDKCDFSGMNIRLDRCSELMVESLYRIVNSTPGAPRKPVDSGAIKTACDPHLHSP